MPNDDVINIVNQHHINEKVKQEQNKTEKSRVSNEKGEVIGIVTFFAGLKNTAINYILADRKRTIALMTALTIGVIGADVAVGKGLADKTKEYQETLAKAQEASVSEAISALDTDTYNDDAAIVDYYMQSVVKDPTVIKPTDKGIIYNVELRTRLENLAKKIQALQSGETLGVDREALIAEYKKEYTAIVNAMQEQNIYYNLDHNIETMQNNR